MSDLISRQAAIDAIRKDMYADKDYMSGLICDGIEDVLKNLPSVQPEVYDSQKEVAKYITAFCDGYDRGKADAQPEQQWIPCSDHTPDIPIRVQVQLDNGWIITAYRQDDEWLSVPDCEVALRDERRVVAWMPLPEPWRGEEK